MKKWSLIDTWLAIPVVYFPLSWKNHQGLVLIAEVRHYMGRYTLAF